MVKKMQRREMEFYAKETAVHIRKGLAFSIPIIYKSGCDHPFVWGMLFFLFVLYRYLPSLCSFVVSSSPVIICTSLLLGTLLAYSDTDVSEAGEEERNVEASRCGRAYTVSREMINLPLTTVDYNNHDQNASSVSSSSGSKESSLPDDEDDAQADKDDVNESVLTWTEVDQKNLMDLGTSELERNQRLENLIAKRTARKFLSFHYAEKNLIDLDTSDSVPSHFQISSVSAPRKNPFDVPFEEDTADLPPIPGSAPSVLQPRQNPFHLQGHENNKQNADNGDIWVAPSTLASVDENESRSKEINEIREQDVIQVDDIGPPIQPVLPNLTVSSGLSYVGSDSNDNADERDQLNDNVTSNSSSVNAKPLTPTVSHYERAGSINKLLVNPADLPPIVEEQSEVSKTEDDQHESVIVEEPKEEVDEESKPDINNEVKDCAIVEVQSVKKSNGVIKRVDVFSTGALKLGKIKNIRKFKFGTKSKNSE